MSLDSQKINEYLLDFFNKTNLSTNNAETIYQRVIESIYDSSYEESKLYSLILVIVLVICSLFGSISNLFVIFIFNFNFTKNRNRSYKIQQSTFKASVVQHHQNNNNNNGNTANGSTKRRRQSVPALVRRASLLNTCMKGNDDDNHNHNGNGLNTTNGGRHQQRRATLAAINEPPIPSTTPPSPKLGPILSPTPTTSPLHRQNQAENSTIELYATYNFKKKQLIYNSNLKLFYTLIRYLAIIDLFTCSVAIPVTAFEIYNNMKMGEFFCKLFEFIRAIGVISSNFIIILISIERYIALYKLNIKNFKIKLFKLRILIVFSISILLGVVCMLQVSVYQKVDNHVIYIGICLPSQLTFKNELSKVIWILITSVFICGSVFVSVIYILIFKRTFEINQRRRIRKETEHRIFEKARSNSVLATNSIKQHHQQSAASAKLLSNIERKLSESEKTTRRSKFQRYFCCCFHLNRNFRIAVMILLVTFIYYLSIVPWCLTINDIIKYNPYIHYAFLLNNTINPLIYGFFNPYFRNCCLYLLKSIFNSMSNKVFNLVHR